MSGKAVHVAAIDLGAGGGRVIDVAFDGDTLTMSELHRFPNTPVTVRGTLHWDVLRLWGDIQTGLQARHPDTASIAVDTWGVDFGLLDRDGNLLANPVHYRDSRTDNMMEWVFERVPRRDVFERTGIQFMQLNTLYQLAAMVKAGSPLLDYADTLLGMPDLFNYWLTGAKVGEYSFLSTTQMLDARTRTWATDMLETVGIPTRILPAIIQPGTVLGEYDGAKVIASTSHDTASAVVGVPTTETNAAYLSSGTWSLLGVEMRAPVITDAAYAANVTNEGGYGDTIRFLKNIMGLWLIEQSLATWRAEGRDYTYAQVIELAASVDAPFRSLIDPENDVFLPPGDMPARVRAFCQQTGQPHPETDAEVLAALFVSLALKYRYAIDNLEQVGGQSVSHLHIIGGGSQNTLLSQMTANAINRPVYTGPIEATAIGNAVVQLITLDELGSVGEARAMLQRSVGMQTYTPQDTAIWAEHYERFKGYLG